MSKKLMLKILMAVALVSVCFTVTAWSDNSIPPATIGLPEGLAPVIEFKETTYNFGKVTEGEKIHHIFKFKNAGGGAVLTIKKVQPTCGCTAALTSADIIAPGGRGEVKVTFNSRGYSGKVHKTVRVKSDDPKNPVVELHMNGEIIKKKHISGAATTHGSSGHISGN